MFEKSKFTPPDEIYEVCEKHGWICEFNMDTQVFELRHIKNLGDIFEV